MNTLEGYWGDFDTWLTGRENRRYVASSVENVSAKRVECLACSQDGWMQTIPVTKDRVWGEKIAKDLCEKLLGKGQERTLARVRCKASHYRLFVDA